MHFEVVVVFIVIEIHIRLAISLVHVIELISIALRDDISVTIHTISSSFMGSIVEAISNEGMNLVVVSLINIRWFVICLTPYKKLNGRKRRKGKCETFHINNWLKWGVEWKKDRFGFHLLGFKPWHQLILRLKNFQRKKSYGFLKKPLSHLWHDFQQYFSSAHSFTSGNLLNFHRKFEQR